MRGERQAQQSRQLTSTSSFSQHKIKKEKETSTSSPAPARLDALLLLEDGMYVPEADGGRDGVGDAVAEQGRMLQEHAHPRAASTCQIFLIHVQ
jgi:hypothetical protein